MFVDSSQIVAASVAMKESKRCIVLPTAKANHLAEKDIFARNLIGIKDRFGLKGLLDFLY